MVVSPRLGPAAEAPPPRGPPRVQPWPLQHGAPCGTGLALWPEQPHWPEPASSHTLSHSGADDLLPILSFVVLRSGLPQLVSECAALEEFIHEG